MQIRNMDRSHAEAVLAMMETFYHSPAVHTDGSMEIYRADVENCLKESPYLQGFVFTDAQQVVGYAMIAKSFSTEYGRPCIWIEDLYLLPQYRGKGLGSQFFALLEKSFPGTILRLEVEEENSPAVHTYHKNGFTTMPYMEMMKLL